MDNQGVDLIPTLCYAEMRCYTIQYSLLVKGKQQVSYQFK